MNWNRCPLSSEYAIAKTLFFCIVGVLVLVALIPFFLVAKHYVEAAQNDPRKILERSEREQAAARQEQAAAAQRTAEHFQKDVVSPNELQSALSFKTPQDVLRLLRRPNSTSRGDTEWFYNERVIHPITGKPDTLCIRFEAVGSDDVRTAYLSAGPGGMHWTLNGR